MNLREFEELAVSRRATRHFLPDPIDIKLLEQLLDIARWAPSGYNIQPTHFFVITDKKLKDSLYPICMEQSQILEAPAIVVFAGDRRAAENNFEKAIAIDLEQKAITKEYAERLRGFVTLAFKQNPIGINWFWKALLIPIVRLFRPIPLIPAVYKRNWVDKQVMLTAMNFMLAANATKLSTVPMEGFDEGKLRKLLKIPSSFTIPVIIPIGYSATTDLKKTRLPLKDIIHFDKW
ncbi:MAG: nitroreductase family protein [Acidobacteria bacterium]|nr:nitroreductase family protein [Acidobacteriota bacterium]